MLLEKLPCKLICLYRTNRFGGCGIVSALLCRHSRSVLDPYRVNDFNSVGVLAGLLLKLRYAPIKPAGVATLFSGVMLQAALLFAWHSPPGIGLAMNEHAQALLMQASLLVSAFWFWLTVFKQTGEHV